MTVLWVSKTKPKDSPTALYMTLHEGTPPPNVFHIGVSSSKSRDLRPGVYVSEIINIESNEEQNRNCR